MMTKKNKENRFKREWHKTGLLMTRGTFNAILDKKRSLEYKSKLKAYSVFLKEDLEHYHFSILQMLRFKISRNHRYLIRHGLRLDMDPKKIKLMEEVVHLLQKVEAGDFGQDAAVKKMTAQWKPIRKRYKDQLPPKLLKKSNSEYSKITNLAHSKRKAALKRAFSIIVENIWFWWDDEYAGDQSSIIGRTQFVAKRISMDK